MPNFKIENKHLILRHMRESGVDGMFELDSNPLVNKYLGNKPITNKSEAEDIIASNIKQHINRGIARWVAIEKSSGDFIGWSGLRLNNYITFNNTTNFYDVGYRFIPKYWGKGYATESAKASLKYFFEVMKKNLIVGLAEVANTASNKVLKKIGLNLKTIFTHEGKQINWYELNREVYAKTMS